MAKQPTTGQKKSKEQISKAASQKKNAKKKWTKGKVKDKSNNVVFLDKATHDRIVGELSRMGKLISVSTVVERFKVSGSLARRLIKDLLKTNQLKYIEQHSKQALLVSTAPPKKAEEAGPGKKDGDQKEVKKAAKKAPKEKEPKEPKEPKEAKEVKA